MDVWYVSYGSNLCEDRFMCYIYGDRPPGSAQAEIGCTDKTPPQANGKIEIPYSLYFSKERSKWGIGGVAFIDHERKHQTNTIGRRYLITGEQFSEVVAQENNRSTMYIDLEQVIANGSLSIGSGWYGRVVYLGVMDGAPMFTFTNNDPKKNMKINKPATAYLSTIARGLLELGLEREEVVEYFMSKEGIRGFITNEKLKEYIIEVMKR
ncbi:hypothetical protein ACFSTA_14245 [Ornithinibacillus salinisoli]|uniref:Histone deacetylase n=1 Tax=Ornithinibacillus salinisoli TaxID=1848459 RepID=A0ABW4W1U5_9BACI